MRNSGNFINDYAHSFFGEDFLSNALHWYIIFSLHIIYDIGYIHKTIFNWIQNVIHMCSTKWKWRHESFQVLSVTYTFVTFKTVDAIFHCIVHTSNTSHSVDAGNWKLLKTLKINV